MIVFGQLFSPKIGGLVVLSSSQRSPDSSSVHSSKNSITSKQAAALFRRDIFILLQVCLTRRHFILFTFLRRKSLELAARETLLARLPVNYRQLSRTSFKNDSW